MGRRARIARADPDSPGLGLICPGCSGVNHAALASPFQARVRRHGGVARQPGSASVGRQPDGLGGWGRGPSHATPPSPNSMQPEAVGARADRRYPRRQSEGWLTQGRRASPPSAQGATEALSRSGPLQGSISPQAVAARAPPRPEDGPAGMRARPTLHHGPSRRALRS